MCADVWTEIVERSAVEPIAVLLALLTIYVQSEWVCVAIVCVGRAVNVEERGAAAGYMEERGTTAGDLALSLTISWWVSERCSEQRSVGRCPRGVVSLVLCCSRLWCRLS